MLARRNALSTFALRMHAEVDNEVCVFAYAQSMP